MTPKFRPSPVHILPAFIKPGQEEILRCRPWAMHRVLFVLKMLSLTIALTLWPLVVHAQELLDNRSFETPVAPANGNNFYASIPAWTVTHSGSADSIPVNIVRPHAGYGNNALVTPAGGGIQYLDVQSPVALLKQTISIPAAGMVDLSGWYAVREGPRAITGLVINVRNSNNVIVASASTSFSTADPMGLWKVASASNIPVAAGIYTFEVAVLDYSNFDLASLVFKPAIVVNKTSSVLSDSVSEANPKMIPGAIAEYNIIVSTPADYTISNDSLFLTDAIPDNMSLIVTNADAPGVGPAFFTSGTSGLSYNFMSLASLTDDIEFSNNNGLSWTYSPFPAEDGTDPAVTTIRLRPKGSMAPNATLIFRIRFKVQ